MNGPTHTHSGSRSTISVDNPDQLQQTVATAASAVDGIAPAQLDQRAAMSFGGPVGMYL